jgi:hypothetical protein
MKRALCLFSILFALAVLPALAQDHLLNATIPFEFTVKGKVLPAGNYMVGRATPSGAWMIKSEAGAGGVLFVVVTQDYGQREQPKLLFRPVSKQEAIIRAHAGRPVHVTLVPRLARK